MNVSLFGKLKITEPNEFFICENSQLFFIKISTNKGIEKNYEFHNGNKFADLTFYRCPEEEGGACTKLNKTRMVNGKIINASFSGKEFNCEVGFILENNDNLKFLLVSKADNNLVKIVTKINRNASNIKCVNSYSCQDRKRYRRAVLIPNSAQTSTTVPCCDDD